MEQNQRTVWFACFKLTDWFESFLLSAFLGGGYVTVLMTLEQSRCISWHWSQAGSHIKFISNKKVWEQSVFGDTKAPIEIPYFYYCRNVFSVNTFQVHCLFYKEVCGRKRFITSTNFAKYAPEFQIRVNCSYDLIFMCGRKSEYLSIPEKQLRSPERPSLIVL